MSISGPENPSEPRRRSFLQSMANGVLGCALAHLLQENGRAADRPSQYNVLAKPPHHAPRATSIIHLFQNGGPSQMDLFDPKPALGKYAGQPFPGNVEEIGNQGTDQIGSVMQSPFRFKKHGLSGTWISDALPYTSKIVDDLCFMHSLWTDHPNHDNALYKIHSGQLFMGHPSLGSWVAYGLGSECQELPAYVVLDDPRGLPKNGVRNWTAGYLPPVYQGTRFRTVGDPVLNLKQEFEQPAAVAQLATEMLDRLDERHRQARPGYLELDARIEAYNLAARMQLSASDALDLSSETQATLDAYGIGNRITDSYGRRCLLARRLVERGVRFVQLFLDDQPWDNHSNLEGTLLSACQRTDQPAAALITDLKQRGLLDSTLVIWGGEFGRTPTSQKIGNVVSGRDHNMQAFTSWFAGAGVRGGMSMGKTDDFGHQVIESPVSVADFHATILYAMGLDSQRLAFERNGFKERLTGLKVPRVAMEIFSSPEGTS